MMNYNNLFFKTVNPLKTSDFLKRLGVLYDLSINLLNEQMSFNKVKEEHIDVK